MKKLSLVLILVMGLGMVSAGMVQADPIVVGNPQWYAFEFDFPPTFAVGISNSVGVNPGAPPWTYTALTPTAVKITDSFTAGDMFSLYDNGLFVGTTSTVPTTPTVTNNATADLDYLDPLLSHGLFTLAAGSHALTIKPSKSTMVLQISLHPSVWPTSGSMMLRFPSRPAPCCWAPACWGWWDGGDSGRLKQTLLLATDRCRVSHGPAFFVVQ